MIYFAFSIQIFIAKNEICYILSKKSLLFCRCVGVKENFTAFPGHRISWSHFSSRKIRQINHPAPFLCFVRNAKFAKMLRRAWTMVVGYLVTYATFTYTYQHHASVKKFFPVERVPHLLIGYVFFLYGLTEASTWIIRKTATTIQAWRPGEIITENHVWLGCEVIWWWVVAHASILLWAALGEFYHAQHKKMFAFSIFTACMAEYINSVILPE